VFGEVLSCLTNFKHSSPSALMYLPQQLDTCLPAEYASKPQPAPEAPGKYNKAVSELPVLPMYIFAYNTLSKVGACLGRHLVAPALLPVLCTESQCQRHTKALLTAAATGKRWPCAPVLRSALMIRPVHVLIYTGVLHYRSCCLWWGCLHPSTLSTPPGVPLPEAL
jgi:hypothetical protein